MTAVSGYRADQGAERKRIRLVEILWHLECRHQLGIMPTGEYRRRIGSLLRNARDLRLAHAPIDSGP